MSTADDGAVHLDVDADLPVETAETEAVASEPGQPTGVRAADEARERLAEIDDAPLDEHVEVYEDVHRRLHEGLADLDES